MPLTIAEYVAQRFLNSGMLASCNARWKPNSLLQQFFVILVPTIGPMARMVN